MNTENVGFYKHLFMEDELYVLDHKQELKDVCIVLSKKPNSKNETFLGNILSAVKLSLFSVSTLYSEKTTDLNALETSKIIVFDNDNFTNYPLYEPQKISDDKIILRCDALEEISNDKALKGKLWGQLQKLFLV